MARGADIVLPRARLSFPHLFKPSKNDEGKESYNCVLLIPKSTNLDEAKAAVLAAAVDEWGDKAKKWFLDDLVKSPFLDGDGKQGLSKKTGERHAGYEGHTFIRATSGLEYRPKVYDRNINLVLDPAEAYAGCFVIARVNPFTWDNDKNGKGVTFGISMLQIVADGEKLGGGEADPKAVFNVIKSDDGDKPPFDAKGKGAGAYFP